MPIAYWAGEGIKKGFSRFKSVSDTAKPVQGMITGDNDRFLRQWHEVSHNNILTTENNGGNWAPYNKGGEFRKWYGNHDTIADWKNTGKDFTRNRSVKADLYFKPYV